MKYLNLLLLTIFFFNCQNEKLEPEQVAVKYIQALYKLEYKAAKKYASSEVILAIDHRKRQIDQAKEKYLLDVSKPVIPKLDEVKEDCYTFTVYYTRIDEQGRRGVGETICLKKIRGRWKVVLNQ